MLLAVRSVRLSEQNETKKLHGKSSSDKGEPLSQGRE